MQGTHPNSLNISQEFLGHYQNKTAILIILSALILIAQVPSQLTIVTFTEQSLKGKELNIKQGS